MPPTPPDHQTVYPGIVLGADTVVEPPCVLGRPPRGCEVGERQLVVGADGTIRAFTTTYGGPTIGDRFQSGHGAVIREDNVVVGDVSIGTNAVPEAGNRIGSRARIRTGCFLELVTVADDAFIAPEVVFADDPHPPCPRYEECVRGAVVKQGARIGSNATILPGVVVGRGALVGAGSVVVEDVPDGAAVVGSPAKVVKRVDELVCRSGLMDRPYGSRAD